jgi:ketosteroid isomerase-like protein
MHSIWSKPALKLMPIATVLLSACYAQVAVAAPKTEVTYAGARAMQEPELAGIAWRKAVLAGDAPAVCAMYGNDSIAFMPDKLVLRGKDEICDYFTKWLGAYNVTQDIIDIKYQIIDGTHMLGWGIYKTTATPKKGGDSIIVTGSAFDYSVKRHGKWITVVDHVSLMPTTEKCKE